jgi:hypothetical protein
VVASTTKIIHIVHIHTKYNILSEYRFAVRVKINQANLAWISRGIIPHIPQEEYEQGYLIHV